MGYDAERRGQRRADGRRADRHAGSTRSHSASLPSLRHRVVPEAPGKNEPAEGRQTPAGSSGRGRSLPRARTAPPNGGPAALDDSERSTAARRGRSLHAQLRASVPRAKNPGGRGRSLPRARAQPNHLRASVPGPNPGSRGRSLPRARTMARQSATPMAGKPELQTDTNARCRMPKVPSGDRGRPRSRSTPRERPQSLAQSKARGSTPSRTRQDPAGQSFKQVTATNGRATDDRRGRSGSRSRRRVQKESTQPSRKERADVPKTPPAKAGPPASRKFMVEIGSDGEVVQVFEFSDDGALARGKTPKFVEVMRKQFSKPQQGRSSTKHRSQSPRRGGKTRKIVVESNGRDDIIRVFELSAAGPVPLSAGSCGRRDESPFSRRERTCQARNGMPHEVVGANREVKGRASPGPPLERLSLRRPSQSPSRRASLRASSGAASRAETIAAALAEHRSKAESRSKRSRSATPLRSSLRRSSLRDSTSGRNSGNRRASVSFAALCSERSRHALEGDVSIGWLLR